MTPIIKIKLFHLLLLILPTHPYLSTQLPLDKSLDLEVKKSILKPKTANLASVLETPHSCSLSILHPLEDNRRLTINSILKLKSTLFLNNCYAQSELFTYAEHLRRKIHALADFVMTDLGFPVEHEEYSVVSSLKGHDFQEFVRKIHQKIHTRNLSYVGQLSDMTRGRLNFPNLSFARVSLARTTTLAHHFGFKVVSTTQPKRPLTLEDGTIGYGYPRYRLVLLDQLTNFKCELQFGTQAISDFFDKNHIPISSSDLKKLTKLNLMPNLHDIEYKFFRMFPLLFPNDIQTISKINSFRKKIDIFSAKIGSKGFFVPNYKKTRQKLLREAGLLLREILDKTEVSS